MLLSSFLLIAGCGSEDEAPPLSMERTNLMIRMFESMDKGDYESALLQAEKLQVMNPGNSYLTQVRETMQANLGVVEAQKVLDLGKLERAQTMLQNGVKKYPLNQNLQLELKRINALLAFREQLVLYLKSDLQAELPATPEELSSIPEMAQLQKALSDLREKRLALWRRAEAEKLLNMSNQEKEKSNE